MKHAVWLEIERRMPCSTTGVFPSVDSGLEWPLLRKSPDHTPGPLPRPPCTLLAFRACVTDRSLFSPFSGPSLDFLLNCKLKECRVLSVLFTTLIPNTQYLLSGAWRSLDLQVSWASSDRHRQGKVTGWLGPQGDPSGESEPCWPTRLAPGGGAVCPGK